MIKILKKVEETKNDEEKALREKVTSILDKVRREGDAALLELTLLYDGIKLETIKVDRKAIEEAYRIVSPETIKALGFAAEQIESFAKQQLSCLKPLEFEGIPGVKVGHRLIPVASCGAYIPAGRYPLPSTALMSIIPAKIAGVKRVVACSPPSRDYSSIYPAVLVAMDIAGADEIYCMGGAQAIAAYTYGVESIGKVDMIVGPGNRFVTEAKRLVSGQVGIDILAGPSEVLIIADETANAQFIASDLLAQSEHDPSARGILVTTSTPLAKEVQEAIKAQLKDLKTAGAAAQAWEMNGQIILVDSLEEAVQVSDNIAPEHLELQTSRDEELASQLHNYGSLFMGVYAPVSFGDYLSGTNHILPTMGCGRFSNGVWVGTFIKVASFQKLTKEGAAALAGYCSHLAGVEGLEAHRRAAVIRTE